APTSDWEEAHLRLLYRSRRRHAVGHNVAVRAHVRDGEQRAHRLETDWLPTYDVPATVAPTGTALAGVELSMDALAEADRSEEHTSELQSRENLVCRLLLEK